MAMRQVPIRLDDKMAGQLDAAASAAGLSRSEWIRRTLASSLEGPTEPDRGAETAELHATIAGLREQVAGLEEKVAGREELLASNRERVADLQAHALDLRTELDNAHSQNDTLLKALPAASPGPGAPGGTGSASDEAEAALGTVSLRQRTAPRRRGVGHPPGWHMHIISAEKG